VNLLFFDGSGRHDPEHEVMAAHQLNQSIATPEI
jgi:hypothetical protein